MRGLFHEGFRSKAGIGESQCYTATPRSYLLSLRFRVLFHVGRAANAALQNRLNLCLAGLTPTRATLNIRRYTPDAGSTRR